MSVSPSAHTPQHPVFHEMDAPEIAALLARNHVGRVAFSLHDRVNIQPVHYVYSDGWLYGRTSPGTKLSSIAHQPWVAFEVDEVRGLFDWESGVVHGRFEILDPTWHSQDILTHAVSLMRSIIPESLTADDPVPARTVLFRIYVSDATGRRCALAPAR